MTKKKRNVKKAKVTTKGRVAAFTQEIRRGGKLGKPKPTLITFVKVSGGKKK